MRYQVVTMAQQVPSHVHAVFARLRYEETTISSAEMAAAIIKHAGHAEGAEVKLTEASAAVATWISGGKRC